MCILEKQMENTGKLLHLPAVVCTVRWLLLLVVVVLLLMVKGRWGLDGAARLDRRLSGEDLGWWRGGHARLVMLVLQPRHGRGGVHAVVCSRRCALDGGSGACHDQRNESVAAE